MTEVDAARNIALRDEQGKVIMDGGHPLSSGRNGYGERVYNLGLTVKDMDLLLVLICDEPTSDEDEEHLQGLKRRLIAKRKQLRKRRLI